MVGIGLVAVSSALSGILADRSDVPNWSVVLGSLFSDSMFFATLAGTLCSSLSSFLLGGPRLPAGARLRGWPWAHGERGARSDPAHTGRRDRHLRGRRSPRPEDSAIGTAVIVVLLACMVLARRVSWSVPGLFRRRAKQVAWLT